MSNNSKVYRQLLAAVDLSEVTGRVLDRALALGDRCEADVDLANILEGTPAFLYHAVSAEELSDILDKGARWSHERLSELKTAHPGIEDVHTARGILAEEIRDLVVQIDANLLVIGAHDRRGFMVLFRDRSDEILHRAPCDVLVVKGESAAAPYKHLLAAVDLEGDEVQLVEHAAWLAGMLGADLSLMHVIEHFPVDRSNLIIPPEDQDPQEFEHQQTLSRLQELAQAAGVGDCRQELPVSVSTASREIPSFAAANGVDLIVTGSHGRHGLGRLLGSTADGIVHRAECDVLVVRRKSGK